MHRAIWRTLLRRPAVASTVTSALASTVASALASTLAMAAAPLPAQQSARVQPSLARAIAADLIAVPSASGWQPGDGDTRAAAAGIAARFRAAGVADRDITTLAPAERPQRANLLVRLRGSDRSAKPLLIIAHLDVVPAAAADWTVPPYQLTEKAGYLYGRGILDMKGEIAVFTAALLRIHAGRPLRRDVILALTADEENGDGNGVAWLLANHRARIDAGVVLNPDAGGGATVADVPRWFGIQTAEKTYATWEISTTNKGGHSSRPEHDNAIYRLAAALGRVQAAQFPASLGATTRGWFAARARLETGRVADDMRAIATAGAVLPAAPLARLSQVVETAILLRTTCVATELSGGHAQNALPQAARATIQCRLLPQDSAAQAEQILTAAIADPGVALKAIYPADPGPETTPDPAIMAALAAAIHAQSPGLPVLTQMDAGATDGKILRAAGYPVYGVAAIFNDIDDVRAHGRDERVRTSRFETATDLAEALIRAMAK
jgi:acetylornithine deacetylase/succinyl-diaminopimelate desuccinylase-like protein